MPSLPTVGGSTDTWGTELNDWLLEGHSAGGRNPSVSIDVNQSSHGLSVGNAVKVTGTDTYAKAKADSAANSEVVGIVSEVADTNNFTLLMAGKISGLSSLSADTVYFLDPTTAGALTSTEPSTSGQVSKPLLVATSTTEGIFINMRGVVIVDETLSDAWTYVNKTADESVASNTSPQNDDELFFTTVSGAAYEMEVVLIYASPAGGGTPDIKMDLGEDGTARGDALGLGIGSTEATASGSILTNQSSTVLHGTAATNRVMKYFVTYVGGGGTFRVRWAQGTSSVNATIVRAGSLIRYRVLA